MTVTSSQMRRMFGIVFGGLLLLSGCSAAPAKPMTIKSCRAWANRSAFLQEMAMRLSLQSPLRSTAVRTSLGSIMVRSLMLT